jgi:hypothetical protein
LLEQVRSALDALEAADPNAAARAVRTAIVSLRDLDSLLEAYSLAESVSRSRR